MRTKKLIKKNKPIAMKCPICEKLGTESNLFPGSKSTTLLHCQPYYDKDGNHHHHDRNTTTSIYNCSHRHKFVMKSRNACQSYPEHCDFEGRENIEVIDPEGFEI